MKIWFVLYLLGKAAFVVGPLPYGIGHCWAKGKEIIDQINQDNLKFEHLAWEYSCLEMNRSGLALARPSKKSKAPLIFLLTGPRNPSILSTDSWENRDSKFWKGWVRYPLRASRRKKLRDLLGFVTMIMVGLFGMVVFIIWMDSISCDNQLKGLNAIGYYKVLGGCFVQANDSRFVPLDKYLGMENIILKRKESE